MILAATRGPTVNDGLLSFYQANGAVSNSINDAEYEFLLAQGATPAHINDMWYEFLTSTGHTGALDDMLYVYWASQSPIGPVTHDGQLVRYNGDMVMYNWEEENMPELFDILNLQETKLLAPLIINETDGEVTVISATASGYEAGEKVKLTITFITTFNAINDQLWSRVDGDLPSPTFMKEAKDPNESVPFSYTFIIDAPGGDINLDLVCWVDGAGTSAVELPAANMIFQRVE